MSGADDRIPIPVNGHRAAGSPAGSPAEPAPAEPAPAEPTLAGSPPGSPVEPGSTDPRIVVSPTQLAIGFAIVASILALLAGRAGRRARGRARRQES
jgi:hypothetical protein